MRVIEDLRKSSSNNLELETIYENIISLSRKFVNYSFSFVNTNANIVTNILVRRWCPKSVVWLLEPQMLLPMFL